MAASLGLSCRLWRVSLPTAPSPDAHPPPRFCGLAGAGPAWAQDWGTVVAGEALDDPSAEPVPQAVRMLTGRSGLDLGGL